MFFLGAIQAIGGNWLKVTFAARCVDRQAECGVSGKDISHPSTTQATPIPSTHLSTCLQCPPTPHPHPTYEGQMRSKIDLCQLSHECLIVCVCVCLCVYMYVCVHEA